MELASIIQPKVDIKIGIPSISIRYEVQSSSEKGSNDEDILKAQPLFEQAIRQCRLEFLSEDNGKFSSNLHMFMIPSARVKIKGCVEKYLVGEVFNDENENELFFRETISIPFAATNNGKLPIIISKPDLQFWSAENLSNTGGKEIDYEVISSQRVGYVSPGSTSSGTVQVKFVNPDDILSNFSYRVGFEASLQKAYKSLILGENISNVMKEEDFDELSSLRLNFYEDTSSL